MPAIFVPIQVPQIAKPEIVHRTTNFQPCIWGDRFINYDSQQIVKHNITAILGGGFYTPLSIIIHICTLLLKKKNCLKLGTSVKCIENQASVKTMPLA
jgi:hypothetical protein